jgi:hypothetical protein
MVKRCPYAYIRFPSEQAKKDAEQLADENGLSLSMVGHLLFQRAVKDKLKIGFSPRRKPHAQPV